MFRNAAHHAPKKRGKTKVAVVSFDKELLGEFPGTEPHSPLKLGPTCVIYTEVKHTRWRVLLKRGHERKFGWKAGAQEAWAELVECVMDYHEENT